MSVNNRWIDATDNPRSAATACVARESNWKGGRKCPDKFLQSTHIGAQLLFSLFLRSTFVRLLVGKAKCTFPRERALVRLRLQRINRVRRARKPETKVAIFKRRCNCLSYP